MYVADRENHRVQVFDGNGKYEAQWNNMHRPCGLFCHRGAQARIHHRRTRLGRAVNRLHPNIGPRISIVDKHGALIARLGGKDGPGNVHRQIHRAAWRRARFARRYLRRRSELHRLADDASG